MHQGLLPDPGSYLTSKHRPLLKSHTPRHHLVHELARDFVVQRGLAGIQKHAKDVDRDRKRRQLERLQVQSRLEFLTEETQRIRPHQQGPGR